MASVYFYLSVYGTLFFAFLSAVQRVARSYRDIEYNIMRVRRPGRIAVISLSCFWLDRWEIRRAWTTLRLGLFGSRSRSLNRSIASIDRGVSTSRDNDEIIHAWMLTKEPGYVDLLEWTASNRSPASARAAWDLDQLKEEFPQWIEGRRE